MLGSQHYLLEVAGLGAAGGVETVASYTFRSSGYNQPDSGMRRMSVCIVAAIVGSLSAPPAATSRDTAASVPAPMRARHIAASRRCRTTGRSNGVWIAATIIGTGYRCRRRVPFG